jgi:hypothetical protein
VKAITPSCSPKDEPAVAGRAVASEGGSTLNHQLSTPSAMRMGFRESAAQQGFADFAKVFSKFATFDVR